MQNGWVKLFLQKEKIIAGTPFILLAILAISISFYAPNFLTYGNFLLILKQSSILLIVATAATLPILMGSIDLSVAAMLNLTGIVAALYVPQLGIIAIIPAILIGVFFGLINGLVFVYFKLPSFLVTLGTMAIMEGTSLLLSGGTPIWFKNDNFIWISKGSILGNVPNIIIWSFLIYFVSILIGTYTKFGRYMVAIGGGEKVTMLSGVNVNRYKILAFTFGGLLCGIAGVLLTARVESASPFVGTKMLLDAIAAVVIGGTSLTGGVGGIHKTFIGVILITVLSNGLDMAFVQPYYQMIIKGLVVIVAVTFTLDRSRLTLFK
jgi:ribose transport system permease protein